MSLIITPNKGCVTLVRREFTGSRYTLSPAIPENAAAPIIIDGAEVTEKDSLFAVSTLDERQYLYTFGKNFGDFVISGRIMLGRDGEGRQTLAGLEKWFKVMRSSAERYATIVTPSSTKRIAVTAMTVGRPDPQFNIIVFAIKGLAIDPPKA